jgi:dual specificity phosphatase 12
MTTEKLSATEAQEAVRRAREQVWFNAGLQEQLVIWGICQHNITPDNTVYKNWRMKIDSSLELP